jgi:hypothetical protein
MQPNRFFRARDFTLSTRASPNHSTEGARCAPRTLAKLSRNMPAPSACKRCGLSKKCRYFYYKLQLAKSLTGAGWYLFCDRSGLLVHLPG